MREVLKVTCSLPANISSFQQRRPAGSQRTGTCRPGVNTIVESAGTFNSYFNFACCITAVSAALWCEARWQMLSGSDSLRDVSVMSFSKQI